MIRHRASAGPESHRSHSGRPAGARHNVARIDGLVVHHESVDPQRIVPVFRANLAVAFDRMSRSSFNWRFSRRRREISSRSAVVKPSGRWPPSRSAWVTQFRIVRADGSNSDTAGPGWLGRLTTGFGGRSCVVSPSGLPSPIRVQRPRKRVNSRSFEEGDVSAAEIAEAHEA